MTSRKRKVVEEEEDEFTVEKILDKRRNKDGGIEYLIKWENCPVEDSTWEPESNANCPDLITEFENELRKKMKKEKSETEESPEAETIIGMTEQRPGDRLFVVRFTGGSVGLVPTEEAYTKFPLLCLRYYEGLRRGTGVATVVSKVSKKGAALRLLPEALQFIALDPAQDGGFFLFVTIPTALAFSSYIFCGLSAEANSIVLEVDIVELAEILSRAHGHTKMKLFTEGGKPHLLIEERDSHCITHIPVKVVPRRLWPVYEKLTLPQSRVSVYMPSIRQCHKMLQAFRTLGGKYVVVRASTSGELRVSGKMEQAKIAIFFPDTVMPDSESREMERASASMNLKALMSFLIGFGFAHSNKALLHVIDERRTELSLVVLDATVSFIMGSTVTANS